MSSNPYRPPEASVADPSVASDSAPAPARVRRALQLLLAAVAIGSISILPSIRGPVPGAEEVPPGLYFGLFGVFVLLFLTLIVFLAKRHNWARWATFAYLLLGWVAFLADLPEGLTGAPLAAMLDAVVFVLEIWACVLLFTAPSARWFRRESPEEAERA